MLPACERAWEGGVTGPWLPWEPMWGHVGLEVAVLPGELYWVLARAWLLQGDSLCHGVVPRLLLPLLDLPDLLR